MATADLITELNTDLGNAYNAIEAKGGTIPENKNTNNLTSAIESISGGGGGDDYEIPYFDGGGYGAIAYLGPNNEVRYYTIPADKPSWLNIFNSSSYTAFSVSIGGVRVTTDTLLAVSFGDTPFTVGTNFLYGCTNLRRVYGFEKANLTQIPNYVLYNCPHLDCDITVPEGVTSIGNYFLAVCPSFNGKINLPSTLQSIGDSFLYRGSMFDQPLVLPEGLTSIGQNFMTYCLAFKQPLTLPSTITVVSSNFLECASTFTGPLTVNCTVAPSTSGTLNARYSTYPAYVNGVILKGPGATTWKDALPDASGFQSIYRKLILE